MGRMIKKVQHTRSAVRSSRGFGIMEVMASLFVIVVALTGLLSLFGHGISTMKLVGDDLIAKQKARECLESIFTARNTQQVDFDGIQNSPDGIFLAGYQPLKRPNPSGGGGDGLVGTSDDGPIESITLAGPDELMGTGDDETRVLLEFDRQIQIDPILYADSTVNPDVRRVTVRIRFPTPLGRQRVYEVESYVSRFR